MDLFQIRFRGIRFCFLLCFVKKTQLGVTVRIFFAGSTKPLPLGKSQTVRKHRIQEFQLLRFLFQKLDPCFLFLQRFFLLLTMLLHDLQQREHILPAHPVQLFPCKNRIHDTPQLSEISIGKYTIMHVKFL